MTDRDIWTGTFMCKVCGIEYVKSIYTTKDGMVCNFGCSRKKKLGEGSHDRSK